MAQSLAQSSEDDVVAGGGGRRDVQWWWAGLWLARRHGDFFGFSPQYKLPRYRSFCGLAASVVVGFVLFLYFVISVERYANDPFVFSESKTVPDYSPVQGPVIGLVFFSRDGSAFYNESWFEWKFLESTIWCADRADVTDCPSKVAREHRQLASRACTAFPTTTQINMALTRCPVPPFALEGTYGSTKYTYLEAQLRLCCTPSSCPAHCEGREQVQAMLNLGSITVLYEEEEKEESTSNQRFVLNSFSYQTLDVFVAKVFEKRHARYFELDRSHSSRVRVDKFSLYAHDATENSNGTVGFKVFARLSPYSFRKSILPSTFLDLLGKWGGLHALLVLVVGSFAVWFNKHAWRRQFRGSDIDVRHLNRDDFSPDGRLCIDNGSVELDHIDEEDDALVRRLVAHEMRRIRQLRASMSAHGPPDDRDHLLEAAGDEQQ